MRTRFFPVFAALALCSTIASSDAARDEIRIIQLKHRTAQEIMPLVRPLLGPNDAVTGVDYRLILRTSDKQFAEVHRFVQQLDVGLRNLTITVTQGVVSDTSRSEQDISASARIGRDARITLPSQRATGGGTVTVTRSRPNATSDVQIRAEQSRSSGESENTQTVRVLEGQRAFIRVGRSTPQVRRILVLTGRQDILASGIEWREVITGFEVLPRINGDAVLLEVTPRLSMRHDSSFDVATFQELTTTVTARLGDWINLGEIVASRHEVNRAILSGADGSSAERRTVMLKVD